MFIKYPGELESLLQYLETSQEAVEQFDYSIFQKFCRLDDKFANYFDTDLGFILKPSDATLARGIDLKSIFESMIEINQNTSI